MRSIAGVGPIAAIIAMSAVVAGCQIVPYTDNRFSVANEAEITPKVERFPILLSYPDNTMFFYPIYEHPPRADLNLRGIDCQTRADGTLAIIVRVQNMGSDIISAAPLTTGDTGAFRVVATVSTANGGQERVEAVQVIPLTVSSTVILASNSTQARASDVTRIDVVADPDRYVPDPVRDNNRLSWKGSIDPANPRCTVER